MKSASPDSKEIKQILSQNLCNKALILQLDIDKFEVSIYEWNNELVDDEGHQIWERVAGPFVVNSLEEAEIIALENLQLFSLEIPDESIENTLHECIKKTLEHDNYNFYKPENFEIEFLANPSEEIFTNLKPEKVLYVDDFYFVENEDQWMTGFSNEKGKIRGWQKFDDLESALREILI